MRKSNVLMLLVISLLIIAISQMSRCSHEDSAFVTIHLQRADLSENSGVQSGLLDRLFTFFISPTYAVTWTPTSPSSWLSGRDTMTVKVTGEGMGDLEMSIPPLQTQATIQIPAGKQRTITVFTSSTNASYNGVNWGGHSTVDLNAGEEVNVIINMLPRTKITAIETPGDSILGVLWNPVSGVSVTKGYYLYKSTLAEGPYTKITVSGISTFFYEDHSGTAGIKYYYKISVYTDTSEGEQSDINSGVPVL